MVRATKEREGSTGGINRRTIELCMYYAFVLTPMIDVSELAEVCHRNLLLVGVGVNNLVMKVKQYEDGYC